MAWWDHEELKSREMRSDRYIVTFYEEYSDMPHLVREAALRKLQDPRVYNDSLYARYMSKLLSYGTPPNQKPRFRVPSRAKKQTDM